MKIYNVIQNGRHTDPKATPFMFKDSAIDFARRTAANCCVDIEDVQEQKIEGWLFYIQYSIEGDCLYITEHDI